jgi:ABC-type thiamine transport system ATPase subunit
LGLSGKKNKRMAAARAGMPQRPVKILHEMFKSGFVPLISRGMTAQAKPVQIVSSK